MSLISCVIVSLFLIGPGSSSDYSHLRPFNILNPHDKYLRHANCAYIIAIDRIKSAFIEPTHFDADPIL